MAHRNPDPIIDEFFGDAPRASEWHALREALADRLRALRRRRDEESDEAARVALDVQTATLKRQVATLATEEVVAQFVEDSIKATVARAPEDYEAEEDEG